MPTNHCMNEKLLMPKNIVVLCYKNKHKAGIFHVLNDKVALLMRRRSEWGTANGEQRIFRKVWNIYIQKIDQEINF